MRGTRNRPHDNLPDPRFSAPPATIRFPFMTPKPPARSKTSGTQRTKSPAVAKGTGMGAFTRTGRAPAQMKSSSRGSATRAPAYQAAARRPSEAYTRVAPPAAPAKSKPLSAQQKRYLRGFAHDLSAIVLVGHKGVTPALLKELDVALAHHELVKIKISDDDRVSRAASIELMRESSDAEIVQTIGHVVCLFRRDLREPKFELPK